jgi:uncharacterized phage protein (TIGR01671 family)
MREIKFRAWDGEEMHYPSAMCPAITIAPECDDSTLIYSLEWDADGDMEGAKITVIRGVSMQYTGLKDVNGVEIYEGDIVEHRSDLSSTSEVKYFEGAFIAGSPVTSNALINFNCANNVSVVGNIYENKELIK